MGAVIPFLAGFQEPRKAALPDWLDLLPPLLIAALGVSVVVLEGVQHLNQYQKTWLDYRSTAEALKHEKFLSLADAGPYVGARDKRAACRADRGADRQRALEMGECAPPSRGPLGRVSGRAARRPVRSGSAGS